MLFTNKQKAVEALLDEYRQEVSRCLGFFEKAFKEFLEEPNRDRLRQNVLEGLGWEIHRIWSTNWFQDPRNEIEKLKKKLTVLLDKKIATATQRISEAEDAVTQHISKSNVVTFSRNEKIKNTEAEFRNDEDPGVTVGDIVKVLYLLTNEVKTFTIVKNKEMPTTEGTIAAPINSPLGQAVEGCEEDDETSFLMQQKQQPLRILSISKPKKNG